MNRYVVEGLLADMRAGKRILVVSSNARDTRDALQDLAAQTFPSETVRRANGAERISLDDSALSGSIQFTAIPPSLPVRLGRADVVFVDHRPHAWREYADLLAAIVALAADVEIIESWA